MIFCGAKTFSILPTGKRYVVTRKKGRRYGIIEVNCRLLDAPMLRVSNLIQFEGFIALSKFSLKLSEKESSVD